MAGEKTNKEKCLGQMENHGRNKAGQKRSRQADFSKYTLADFSLVFDKIKFIESENAVILVLVFFSEIVSNGDFNLGTSRSTAPSISPDRK